MKHDPSVYAAIGRAATENIKIPKTKPKEETVEERTPEQQAMDEKNERLKQMRLEKNKEIKNTAESLGIAAYKAERIDLKMIDNDRHRKDDGLEGLFDLDDIPEELQGIVSKKIDYTEKLVDVLELKHRITNDELIVAMFRRHNLKLNKQQLNFHMKSLITKGIAVRVKQGVYSLTDDYRFKMKDAD